MKIQKTDKQEERNFYMQCSEQRLKAITGKSESITITKKASQNKNPKLLSVDSQYGNRTRVSAVRGRRLNPVDQLAIFICVVCS